MISHGHQLAFILLCQTQLLQLGHLPIVPTHISSAGLYFLDETPIAYCSDRARDIDPGAAGFFIAITLSLADSGLVFARLGRFQKLFLSAFIAH